MAVLLLFLLLLAPSISLKSLAANDHIRLTAYVPVEHDAILGYLECPDVSRSSFYQRERRQHQFDWRVHGCVRPDAVCQCEVGVVVSLRGEQVGRSSIPLIVPF